VTHKIIEGGTSFWYYWRKCSCGWTVEDNNIRRIAEKTRRHIDAGR
jgi:hypothetical protein